MHTYTNLFQQVCEYDNLELAWKKASRGKSGKACVQAFGRNKAAELSRLQWELQTGIYAPGPLTSFIVRDPKTRRISASRFRDRVVHHAVVNVIGPVFESRWIHDSFANRIGKGTSATLERFDAFARKASRNGRGGWGLKADIRHYFETVDHDVLLSILARRIKDERLLDLVRLILANHVTAVPGKGMPLGNLTSQFFANVYLAELDEFVKHELKTKFYMRYVDDFVLLSSSRGELEAWRNEISAFLEERLKLELHPEKTSIMPLAGGVQLVGFRVFSTHRLLKPSNLRRFRVRVQKFKAGLAAGEISAEHVRLSLSGWEGYAKMGDTYELRRSVQEEMMPALERARELESV